MAMFPEITAGADGLVFYPGFLYDSAEGNYVMAHKHSNGQYDSRQLWTCSACGKEVKKNGIICSHCRESLSLAVASSRKSSEPARTIKRFWKQIFF
jgi:predicted amidophosphoribosyltransferase